MQHPCLKNTLSTLFSAPVKQGDLGLELEIEGEYLPTTGITGWSVKSETSLRGKNGRTVMADENAFDTPREYVLSRPIPHDRVLTRLEALTTALKKPGVVVKLTPRASTHIHLNVANETVETLMAFIIVYLTAEPLLLRLCGDQRNGNLFCLPAYETGDIGSFIRGVISQLNKPGYRTWWTRGKYGALNTDPVSTLGSVELRCFPNSVDPQELARWCKWIIAMRDLARGSAAPFENLMTRLYDEPSWLIQTVFGYVSSHSIGQPPTDLVRFGYEMAYEAWRKMEPLFNYIQPEKKNPRKPKLGDPGLMPLSSDQIAEWASNNLHAIYDEPEY